MKKFRGFEIVPREQGYEVIAPCGCCGCQKEVQQGHFSCRQSPKEMVEAAEEGLVARSLSLMEGWQWWLTPEGVQAVEEILGLPK